MVGAVSALEDNMELGCSSFGFFSGMDDLGVADADWGSWNMFPDCCSFVCCQLFLPLVAGLDISGREGQKPGSQFIAIDVAALSLHLVVLEVGWPFENGHYGRKCIWSWCNLNVYCTRDVEYVKICKSFHICSLLLY